MKKCFLMLTFAFVMVMGLRVSDCKAFDLVYDFEAPTYTLGDLYDPNLVGQDGWIRSGAQTATIIDSSGSYPVLSGSQSLYLYGSGYPMQNFINQGYVFDDVIELSATITLEPKGDVQNYFNLFLKPNPGVADATYVHLIGIDPTSTNLTDGYFQIQTTTGRETVPGVTFNQGDIIKARMVINYNTGNYETFLIINDAPEISLGTYDFSVPITSKEASTGQLLIRARLGGVFDDIVLGGMKQCSTVSMPSDLNFDCVVNNEDLAIMASEWLTNSLVE